MPIAAHLAGAPRGAQCTSIDTSFLHAWYVVHIHPCISGATVGCHSTNNGPFAIGFIHSKRLIQCGEP